MTTIGFFTKAGVEWIGEIITLSVQSQDVRIAPNPDRAVNSDPSHLVFVGRAQIGQAWPKRPDSDDLSVTLDDPSFAAAITGDLIVGLDGLSAKLLWDRSARA